MHRLAFSLCFVVFISGCSFFVPPKQEMRIRAEQPDIEILVNGVVVGKGSMNIELTRGKNHTITGRLGDQKRVREINKKVSPVGIVDLVGGFIWLVPWIGVVAPGFWDLEKDSLVFSFAPPKLKSLPLVNDQIKDGMQESVQEEASTQPQNGQLGKPKGGLLGKPQDGQLGKPKGGLLGKPKGGLLGKPTTNPLGQPQPTTETRPHAQSQPATQAQAATRSRPAAQPRPSTQPQTAPK